MKITQITRALLAVFAILFSQLGNATVVYDNGVPDQIAAYYADSTPGFAFTEAATLFTLNTTTDFNGINFWGTYFQSSANPNADFTISFYENNNNLPSTIVASFNIGPITGIPTGNLVLDSTELLYSALFSERSLTAGTYFVGIQNKTPITDGLWAWSTSNANSGTTASFDAINNVWVPGTASLAFQLTETASVPEPTTIALMGLGLVGIATRRRKSVQA